MLPDFFIAIPEPKGRVRARDIPAGAFFTGFPDDLPFTDCFQRSDWLEKHRIVVGTEEWVSRVVTNAVIAPEITAAWELGPARDIVAMTYFETVGWVPRRETSVPATVAPANRKPYRPLPLEWHTWRPGKNLRAMFQKIATKTRRLPSELWAMPISEWNWTLAMLAEPSATPVTMDDEFRRALGLEP